MGQCNEKDAFFRQAVTGTDDGDLAVLRKHCGGLFQASGACAEDSGETLFFFRLLYCPKEIIRMLFLSLPDAENRLGAGGLHRGDEDLFFFWKKACEKGCDFGGRAVTGGQLKLRHAAGFSRTPCGAGAWNRRVLKEVVDLCKGRGSLPDRLEFVSEEHKSCPGEIFFQHHELGCGVVLHFVHHDIFGVQILLPGEKHFEIKPFDSAQSLFAQEPLADLSDIEPLAGVDRVEGAAVLTLDAVFLRRTAVVQEIPTAGFTRDVTRDGK